MLGTRSFDVVEEATTDDAYGGAIAANRAVDRLMKEAAGWLGVCVSGGQGERLFTMKQSFKTGFSFGLTSGVITTLGLMVGLHAGTHSRLAVIGGIVTIAVADALSDALGIHIAEESKNHGDVLEIWESTIATFVAKFLIAMTFVVPVLLLSLEEAIMVSVVWGLCLLAVLSYILAQAQHTSAWTVIAEHLVIGVCVIAITHYVGIWIHSTLS